MVRLACLFVVAGLAGCGIKPYRFEAFDPVTLSALAQSQTAGQVTVTAAVPGREEAERIFGFPIYDRDVQPVWLRIQNQGSDWLRYAPAGSDPLYFSAHEVAYTHRRGYTKTALGEMEQRLYELSMPRQIPPGEARSGFVFTNVSPGTKNLLVDVFSPDHDDHSFAFFLDVPGFKPDHARIEFANLYADEEVQRVDLEGLRTVLSTMGCCTRSFADEPNGLPVAVAMVGTGTDILRALLRAGWYESAWTAEREQVDPEKAHYLFGRLPDAVFRVRRASGDDRNELHVWLAPLKVGETPVWMGLVTHFIKQRTQFENVLFGARFDPNMDEGRDYLLQNLWYSQTLAQAGEVKFTEAAPIEQPRTDFTGAEYHTDGFRLVMWLSGEQISMSESKFLAWDEPPIDGTDP